MAGQNKNKIKDRKIVVYHSRMSWRVCWIISCIILMISIMIGHNSYFLYLYFIVAGIISFLYSITKYAIIDADGIKLFSGSFIKKNELTIKWSLISKISEAMVKRKFLTENMGIDTGLFAPTSLEEKKGILIELNKPMLNESLIDQNRNLKKRFLFNIPADQMFFLDHCPEGGFKHLLLCLKQFNIEKVFVTHSKESKTIKKTILDIILFMITAVLLFLKQAW